MIEEPGYTSPPSTRWVSVRTKIALPPGGQRQSVPKARRWWGLSRWNPREPITIKIHYRGGSECWYQVHARGSIGRFPGTTAIHDMMREIYDGGGAGPRSK